MFRGKGNKKQPLRKNSTSKKKILEWLQCNKLHTRRLNALVSVLCLDVAEIYLLLYVGFLFHSNEFFRRP